MYAFLDFYNRNGFMGGVEPAGVRDSPYSIVIIIDALEFRRADVEGWTVKVSTTLIFSEIKYS